MPVHSTREPGDPIAIVGIGCLFPGCESPAQLWERIQSGTCTTTEVPEGRWLIEPTRALDPRIALADHVYSTKGGFITLPRLDTADLDVDDALLKRLDPLFHLVLHVAAEAWRDVRTEAVDRGRVGVVFGNIVLPTETASALSRELFRRLFEDGLEIRSTGATETHPLNAFPAGLPAAVAAKALRLGSAAYTLDAACGSSLYALKLAVDELQSGRADAMICGGVSRPDPLYTQMGFSQLRALSSRGVPAPFDANADGLVVGEGAGMFVLKRLHDAVTHGDHIYGVVVGIGLSNDVHGDLLAPSAEGQLRAMRQAYEQAGWSPSDVDLIECHATGTPRGDRVELESLAELWRDDPGRQKNRCVIGSVKSNIGHTLTAAGSAGLLKVLLALRYRVLPPSANFRHPHPSLELDESPFRILDTAEPWTSRVPGRLRRAAVSGFGFGGINAHVLIEEGPVPAQTGTGGMDCGGSKAGGHHAERDDYLNSGTRCRAAIAIVGMAGQLGPIGQGRSFQDHILAERPAAEPAAPPNWWGIPSTQWYRQAGGDDQSFPGYYLDSLKFRLDQFRIPPKELVEILPQQSLMLDVAARALCDANWQSHLAPRTGVLIGIGLDLNTTNYHWRWSVPDLARAWSEALGLDPSSEELAHWIEELRAKSEPALSANRTIGSLGGVVASRIAREFQIGGPSFSISCDENSGIQALAIAVDWLECSELDAAIVGAVDFAGDVRAVLARAQLGSDPLAAAALDQTTANNGVTGPVACDGAVCLILKRLDHARRDGDRILAVIREVTMRQKQPAINSSPPRPVTKQSLAMEEINAGCAEPPIGYLDVQTPNRAAPANDALRALANCASDDRERACAVGSVLDDFGHVGAASGLAAVAKVAVCLRQQLIHAPRGSSRWLQSFAADMPSLFVPSGRQFWLRNRLDGPRRAAVHVASLGGALGEVVLEEFEPPKDADESPIWRFEASRPPTYGLFALYANDQAGLGARIEELAQFAREASSQDVDTLARRWWQRHPSDAGSKLATAIVADGADTLNHLLEIAASGAEDHRLESAGRRGSIHTARRDVATIGPSALAFVYPGLGNHFTGMGRELSAIWPEVMRRLDADNRSLRDQFDPALWWGQTSPPTFVDHRLPILASVWVGTLVTEVVRRFAVTPGAAIGYSMGESTALLALRAWTNPEELFSRIRSSSVFQSELAGPCEAARRCWELGPSEPVDWVAGIVSCSSAAVDALVSAGRRVYILARNSAAETVIGGQRRAVAEVVAKLRSTFVELPHVSTVHCEVGRSVAAEYHALHDLETVAPAGIDFYSGVWGRAYPVDRGTAAEAITAQATHRIDFPLVIERAYRDGVRVFLEIGPGSSCTRHIERILGARPHVALSACRADGEPYHTILEVLATLLAWHIRVDLARLYGSEKSADLDQTAVAGRISDTAERTVHINVRGRAFAVPQPNSVVSMIAHQFPPLATGGQIPPLSKGREGWGKQLCGGGPGGVVPALPNASMPPALPPDLVPALPPTSPQNASRSILFPGGTAWSHQLYQAAHATAEAHRAFLRTSQHTAEVMGRLIAFQFNLFQSPDMQATEPPSSLREEHLIPVQDESLSAVVGVHGPPDTTQVVLGREQCLEFAIGSIAAVLGPEYAPIDRFPTRVRLPDEPLLLVDRILSIEGQPRSLEVGRVVTEHVVKPDAWYLDAGKAPACIAIEAGQADLFLSAYLGADFATEGRAVYRLLDATVTFHRGLPGPGEVIRYDIRITGFFRQGDTILFRFQFDATVNGEPLLTMRDGCAGFFSAEELAAGKGIVGQKRDFGERWAAPAENLGELVPMSPTRLDERQVDALRNGDLFAAFGMPFERLGTIDSVRLPAGRMTLLHRVSLLDPRGGSNRLGLIRAEADIRPSDWFLVCHFVDDRVMPGTLMYESCLHALRILLMRMGWVGPRDQVAFEPAMGIANRLRCRGQVVESTRVVTYEVAIKELGYEPRPYAVADALIFGDGKPIVEISDMAVQLSGMDRQGLEQIWATRPATGNREPAGLSPAGAQGAGDANRAHVLFDHDRIVEFAMGKPSAAFGDRYRPFDEGRFLARLPAPPFQFIDRITRIDAQPWVMANGSAATAEYDIPADAWYFEADRQESVPHAVLLEAALQSCGWLAAYMGSALHSDDDLKFRILGGSAVKRRRVSRQTGTLRINVTATKISKTAGMILQQYEYSIDSAEGVVYDGIADLGFFHPRALAQPDGIREFAAPPAGPDQQALARSIAFPTEAPFPDQHWRMVDEILELRLEGPPHGLGQVRGNARIDPDSWLFKAHFLGDPVWPGSLGQESLLQLLKVAAAARWGTSALWQFESPSLAITHEWTYRGQITPENRLITIEAQIKQIDDGRRWLLADGNLDVDGRIIYQMRNYCLQLWDS